MSGFTTVFRRSGLLGLGFGLIVAAGCSDPARQTGTQVQVSEETKAQIQDMRDMYKEMGKTKAKR